MSGRRIVFWRHGRTEWNLARRFQGQTDIPLDDVGIEQARVAARLLTGLSPTAIITSDLTRAIQTAEALAELTGLVPSVDPRLRETDAGIWEGLVWTDLDSAYGDDLRRWAWDPHLPAGGGETRVEVAARVTEAVRAAVDELPDESTLVVVTHGGAARAGIGQMLGLPELTWEALGVLSNCAWTVLAEKPEGQLGPGASVWRLHEYNAGSLPTPALGDDR